MIAYSQHSQLSSILNFPCTVIGVKHFCDKFKAHHAYCGKHLQRNADEVAKKAKESLSPSQFWELATSPTEASYQQTFTKLCSTSPKIAAYLNNVDHSSGSFMQYQRLVVLLMERRQAMLLSNLIQRLE